jgi:hypothetical protein
MVRCPNDASGRNAAIFDIATSEEMVALGMTGTFDAFRAAILASPLTIDLSTLSVTYASVKGVTISSTWTPINYDIPQNTRTGPVRPTYSVNGVAVPIDTDFANEVAVVKSPAFSVINRVLTAEAGGVRSVVDWTGDTPTRVDGWASN